MNLQKYFYGQNQTTNTQSFKTTCPSYIANYEESIIKSQTTVYFDFTDLSIATGVKYLAMIMYDYMTIISTVLMIKCLTQSSVTFSNLAKYILYLNSFLYLNNGILVGSATFNLYLSPLITHQNKAARILYLPESLVSITLNFYIYLKIFPINKILNLETAKFMF